MKRAWLHIWQSRHGRHWLTLAPELSIATADAGRDAAIQEAYTELRKSGLTPEDVEIINGNPNEEK